MRRRRNSQRNSQRSPQKQQKKAIKKRHKISDHFSRKDFYCKSESKDSSFRISAGLIGILEWLRTKSGNRINIMKGYESSDVAEKRGKLKKNYHVQGLAVNITIDNLSLEEAFVLAEEAEELTGIAINYDDEVLHIRAIKGRERECWIEKNGEETLITDENRAKLIDAKLREPAQ